MIKNTNDSQFNNIIFDLGGVLLDIDIKKTQQTFADLGAKQFSNYFGLGHAAEFVKSHELGKISNEQFIEEIHKLAEIDIAAKENKNGILISRLSDEVIIETWNALLQTFPVERIELLKQLKKKYRLFLLSNTNALHLEKVNSIYSSAFNNESFDDLFEKTYYSHLIGLRKPDLEVYEYVLKDSGLAAFETLFIDDALINIQSAEKAGLQVVHIELGMSILDIRL